MTFNFYVGKDYRIYEKRFNKLKEEFKPKINGPVSGAAVFRYIIDLLYHELTRRKKDEEEGE